MLALLKAEAHFSVLHPHCNRMYLWDYKSYRQGYLWLWVKWEFKKMVIDTLTLQRTEHRYRPANLEVHPNLYTWQKLCFHQQRQRGSLPCPPPYWSYWYLGWLRSVIWLLYCIWQTPDSEKHSLPFAFMQDLCSCFWGLTSLGQEPTGGSHAQSCVGECPLISTPARVDGARSEDGLRYVSLAHDTTFVAFWGLGRLSVQLLEAVCYCTHELSSQPEFHLINVQPN